ncbi:MAG TPA: tryptophan 2,3-dioxygenase family protein [Micavibrio sp.]
MSGEDWDQYGGYLRLEQLLGAQTPWSGTSGKDDFDHDEMLFIIFHQTYELWFKQILFELADVQARFSREVVNDRDIQPIVARLTRVVEIFKVLVGQLDVLETMTPQDFLNFRDSLKTASGFQSLQFRLIETRLGLKRDDRLMFNGCPFDRDYAAASKSVLEKAESEPSLYDQIDSWLARTPFIDNGDYKFWDSYRNSVHMILDEKARMARQALDGDALSMEMEAIQRGRRKFDGIFDSKEKLWRLSPRALQAALFITIYRTEPMLQGPSTLLTLLMDVDSLLAQWRYRHALMVQRMTGFSAGTGGSSGYSYLMQTLEKHRIFVDLFTLSTYLIPTRARPPLPESLSRDMGYRSGTDG